MNKEEFLENFAFLFDETDESEIKLEKRVCICALLTQIAKSIRV